MHANIIEARVLTEKRREEKGLNNVMSILKHIKTNMKKKDDDAIEVEEALLSPLSRMFHEPNWDMHTLAILGWRAPGGPNLDLIKDNLVNTLLKEPRFSSLQVMDKKDGGQMRWVPTEVNLDKHIVIHHLDSNNNSSTDELVDDYITTLTRTSMEMSKPLWEIHFLLPKSTDDNNSSTNFLSVLRMHHSLGDGVSLIKVLLSCTRKTSDPNFPPDLQLFKKREINFQRKDEGLFWSLLIKMWIFLRLFANTMIDLVLFFATAMRVFWDSETPIRSSKLDYYDPAHQRFVRCTLNLDDVKFVKNATISTVNDVILGVVQDGLSRYLTSRYGDEDKTDQPDKISKTLKGIRCRASVVVNLRPLLAMNGVTENYVPLGNCYGFILLPLKISDENRNPLNHVRYAKSTMDRKKNSGEVILTSYVSSMILKIFGFKATSSLFRGIILDTTLTFSNIMGPAEEISFCGYPMTFVGATVYGQATSLVIHIVSYMDKLTIGISVDERNIPDPYKLGDYFVESLQDMKIAALNI